MQYIKAKIAEEFSITPGPRFIVEGDFSGEKCFKIIDKKFSQAIKENKKLLVDLDDTAGYGTSFLEEVFGGLARKHGIKKVQDNLIIISEEESYLLKDINDYVENAKKPKKIN